MRFALHKGGLMREYSLFQRGCMSPKLKLLGEPDRPNLFREFSRQTAYASIFRFIASETAG